LTRIDDVEGDQNILCSNLEIAEGEDVEVDEDVDG
jgi:hypothetical protein